MECGTLLTQWTIPDTPPSRQEADDAPTGAARCPSALRPEPSAGAPQHLIVRGIEGRRIRHDDADWETCVGPLSAVRATLARELVTRLDLSLAQTARHLGVPTTAISKILRKRGA